MRDLVLLGLLLAGCPETPVAPPPVAEERAPEVEVTEIIAATTAWRADPSEARFAVVQRACEKGLLVENPTAALDLALGDALSNVMLRPDLGVPRIEPHVVTLDDAGRDAWLDAVLRTQDLPRLAAEHQRAMGAALDVDHPTAITYASQAAHDATVSWRGLPEAVAASRLVESALASSRKSFDRPTESVGPMFEALSMILEGWNIHAVVARTNFPDDPDPMLVTGEVQAADGRRRLIAWVRSSVPAEVKVPGERVDIDKPPRVVTLAAEAMAPGGGHILLASEANLRDGGIWVFSTNDPTRTEAWLASGEMLTELRKKGLSDADAAAKLQERFLKTIQLGELSPRAP